MPPSQWWPNRNPTQGATSEEPQTLCPTNRGPTYGAASPPAPGQPAWMCPRCANPAHRASCPQATSPFWHGMAEVGRDLWRSSCPVPHAQSRVSNGRVLRAISCSVLSVCCWCGVLDKHTRGAATAVTVSTVVDIVSAAAVVKK